MITDCEAVISLGMGPRAAQLLMSLGVRPLILAEPMPLEEAAVLVAQGAAEEKDAGEGCNCHHHP